MISITSEVLERHLSEFENRHILFNGFLNDDFPWQLENLATSVAVSSAYFDYVERQLSNQRAVAFQLYPSQQAELLIYYWSKNKAENMFQLIAFLSQADIGQEVMIVGENRSGIKSVEKLLSQYGSVQKIDSARRCSLYYFQLEQIPSFDIDSHWSSYSNALLENINIYSLPGVFSASGLDMGTALLLKTLARETQTVKGKVLDLGCGAGIIGAYIASQYSVKKLVMSDIDAMALASTERTLSENQLLGEVVASNVFSKINGRFDVIISNPPFHDGIDTAYQAVTNLINQAPSYLERAGRLIIVANAFLPYQEQLEKVFSSVTILDKSNKFKVYCAIK